MGRVYEALNKTDGASAINGAEAAKDLNGLAREDDRLHDPEGQDFDFVPYSLDAPSLREINRLKRSDAMAMESRARLTEPSRTAELDQMRIDHRLTPSYDAPAKICDEFNRAAIALISAASETRLKRVLITAPDHGAGKTLTAINLAFALARARKSVLLIDCDLERPSILRMLGLEAETGLSEIADADVRPGDAAIRIMPQGITVIGMRAPVKNSAELLGNSRLRSILSAFEPDYDFMLFDSGSLLHSSDAKLLARLTDRAVLVISAGSVKSSELGRAIAELNKEQVLGVVLNRFQDRAAGAAA